MRKLGIPSALDRLLQQAVLQTLQPIFDPAFSEHSYGFRPGRSAHQTQAQAQAQEYQQEGYRWVVDMDLEKFFDRVNHDRLMARIAERIDDKNLLKLIRAFLTSGVMEDGLVHATEEGTPQGRHGRLVLGVRVSVQSSDRSWPRGEQTSLAGPLSPLLSNSVLDELDRELAQRGHRFVRYADDCNISVRSRRAATTSPPNPPGVPTTCGGSAAARR